MSEQTEEEYDDELLDSLDDTLVWAVYDSEGRLRILEPVEIVGPPDE